MTSSLVGSEMCIRDRIFRAGSFARRKATSRPRTNHNLLAVTAAVINSTACLLYTSDAADDM
eukprot:7945900-Prorocentrum_lima.AAC.1